MCSVVVALALFVPSQSPADLGLQVRLLVRDLDAGQKAVRDDAERRLIELGAPALAVLPESRPGDSAEVALRLNRVRLALLRLKTAHALEASTVSLHVQNAPLAEVLAEIEKQTGNKLIDYRRQFGQQVDDVAVTLDLDRVPFWQAVDKLNAAAGLTTYAFGGEDGLALVARTANEGPADLDRNHVVYCGAFRVKVRRLTTSRNLDAAAGELQVELEAAWEPRLRPLFLTVAAKNLSLFDDADRRLSPTNPDLVLEVPPQGRASQVEVRFTTAAPRREAKSLRRFRGSFDVLLTAEMHTFRFKLLAEHQREQQRAAAVTVVLEPSRKINTLLELPIRIRYENPVNALESHRAWFYKNPAYLESEDGAKTSPGSTELARQSNEELSLNLMFVDPGDLSTKTFVYQTPADIVSLPIEFEFADLPLP
jgi:hypothetical protein